MFIPIEIKLNTSNGKLNNTFKRQMFVPNENKLDASEFGLWQFEMNVHLQWK